MIGTVAFVTMHVGAIAPFMQFQEALGVESTIMLAGGSAGKTLEGWNEEDRSVRHISLIAGEELSEVVARCEDASYVICDVGHEFTKDLVGSLGKKVILYYDNRNAYVPGGYSAYVAKAVHAGPYGLLFGNAELVERGIFSDGESPLDLSGIKVCGLGYYDLRRAEEFQTSRKAIEENRIALFASLGIEDSGETIIYYCGGANEAYDASYPLFLECLSQNPKKFIVLFHRHPRAELSGIKDKASFFDTRFENIRVVEGEDHVKSAGVCDVASFQQTSMATDFVLASIPSIAVTSKTYPDPLIEGGYVQMVQSSDAFNVALEVREAPDGEAVKKGLGINPEWKKVLLDFVAIGDGGS